MTKRYGALRALDGVTLSVAPGEVLRPARAQRRRQVDDDCGSSPDARSRPSGRARVLGHELPRELEAVRREINLVAGGAERLRAGERAGEPRAVLHALRAPAAPQPPRCSSRCGLQRRRRPQGQDVLDRHAPAPAGGAGAAQPPARCCSSTSRRAGWTRSPPASCARSSVGSPARARRSSSPRTTCTRRTSCAGGWRSSPAGGSSRSTRRARSSSASTAARRTSTSCSTTAAACGCGSASPRTRVPGRARRSRPRARDALARADARRRVHPAHGSAASRSDDR